ncbi:MAG TPA: GntR family transcriptional regulator [Armatimonadota bacterium]|nr:GntR family transcriptional regulator [Armatimonadota bacterium]
MSFEQGLGKRSEEILLALRREIEGGRYPAGGRLPSEVELGRRFGASRNTVRRALARLVADGRLESRRGAGVFVRPWERPAAFSRTLSAMFTFDADSLIAAQNYALAQAYLLCVYARAAVGWDPAPERAFLERVRAERHQALLACCTPTPPVNDDLLRTMAAEGIRILHIEPYRLAPPAQSYLLPDYRRGGYLAATALLLAGYTRPVYVGSTSDWPGARLFQQGFAEALTDHAGGYRPAEHYFEFPTGTDRNPRARAALEDYLRAQPPGTGFVCRSLDFAGEIRDALASLGRAVPDEFGLIGVRYLVELMDRPDIDAITFDRLAGLLRAIDAVTGDAHPDIRDYLPPTLLRRGTMR